jgi:hypothetical protein
LSAALHDLAGLRYLGSGVARFDDDCRMPNDRVSRRNASAMPSRANLDAEHRGCHQAADGADMYD